MLSKIFLLSIVYKKLWKYFRSKANSFSKKGDRGNNKKLG